MLGSKVVQILCSTLGSLMRDKINDLVHHSKVIYHESSVRVDEVKSHFFRLLPFWLAGSLTAFVATIYAKLFVSAEEISLMAYNYMGNYFILLVVACFLISWVLVEKLSPYANGSGIPQLMASVELSNHKDQHSIIDKFLGYRLILVKAISSIVGVIGGGAIGREGPTLQIAGSIFHIIDKKWKLGDSKSRHGFLLAGAASGLASAFNTPLGGIVYVVEELAKSQLSTFRTGVIHAVIFAGLISQMVMGHYLYFGYPKIKGFQFSEFGEVIVLSILAGLMVTLFAQILKSIVLMRGKFTTTKKRAIFTAFFAVLFGLTAIFISPNTMGAGKTLLNSLLFHNSIASISDVFSRLAGSVFTYANGGSGGIFAPTLSLGGATASYFANLFSYDIGTIAVLVGMTSGLAALTHSPLTSFILILEMTDRRSVIFPLMIAAMVGHGISKLISKKSFYEFVADRLLQQFGSKGLSHE